MQPQGHANVGMVYGDTVEERVESLAVHMAAAYHDLAIGVSEQPQGGVRRKNWSKASSGRKPDSYCELMQKAGVIKNVLPVLLYIVDKVVGVELPDHMAQYRDLLLYRRLILAGACAMHEVCEQCGQFFTPTEVARFVRAVDNIIAAKIYLNTYYRTRGAYLFNLTIKVHYLLHLKEIVVETHMNPRFFWVARDEDYISRVALVIKSCMKAGGATRSSKGIAYKMSTGIVMRAAMIARGIKRAIWGVM